MVNSKGVAAVAQGLSLHIGLNSVSGAACGGWRLRSKYSGAFTGPLLKTWGQGAFKGHYGNLQARIKAATAPSQTPNLLTPGTAGLFLAPAPFTV